MSLNDPQPKQALPGDFIRIVNEDELLKDLIGRSMRIGEVKSGGDGDRLYQLIDFSNKPVILVTADEKRVEYWTKREYFEVERRVVEGKDVFFQLSKKKSPIVADSQSELDHAGITVDFLSSMFISILDWVKK